MTSITIDLGCKQRNAGGIRVQDLQDVVQDEGQHDLQIEGAPDGPVNPAQGGHLIQLPANLVFGILALSDIKLDALGIGRHTRFVHVVRLVPQPNHTPLFVQDAVFGKKGAVKLAAGQVLGQDAFPVFGMQLPLPKSRSSPSIPSV